MIDLDNYSKKVRRIADSILAQSKIIETLQAFGSPQLTGSYALDLMYGPDIDIVVITNDPRQVSRAVLDQVLDQAKMAIDNVIYFEVPEEDLVKRLSGRRVCCKCGANYNIYFNPPTQDGVCQKCGGELHQRVDDQEDTIRNRLKVYQKQTEPLIGFYKSKNRLTNINGADSMDMIFSNLVRALDGKGNNDHPKVSSGD